MPTESDQRISINSWLEEELYQQYVNNRAGVDESWKQVFDSAPEKPAQPAVADAQALNTAPETALVPPPLAPSPKSTAAPIALSAAESLLPLRGAPLRIAENMNLSLSMPTATSQRTIPVKVIDENRRLLNQWRELHGKSKISYTHLISWAIVRAVAATPGMNDAYAEVDDQAHRIVRPEINIGIAVDVAGRDGRRSLLVPSVKNAGKKNFFEFLTAFDDLVQRARSSKLTVDDFQGTTISLTNPGTVGTKASVPRLMPGQGAIVATGSIDFPAEYMGVSEETRALLGVCKVMTMTCTYDHRIIQGAESGMFLGKIQSLLEGADDFYDEIFTATGMPYQPVRWQADRRSSLPGFRDEKRMEEIAKQAAVLQLINAYRVRGHLIADVNPLGASLGYHPELDPSTYGLTIWDLERDFITGNLAQSGAARAVTTLRETLETLRKIGRAHV